MLVKKLIQQPITSSKLLVCDPFRMMGREELVKEVIGLANANAGGPRHILFGINPGSMEGSKIVGMSEDAMADLKKAHRHVSEMIEPPVSLAFIFDEFGGKLVGALEISDCDEGPFVVGQDYSRELARGKSWIREGRELREVDVDELANLDSPDPTEALEEADPVDLLTIPPIEVGFNDDPDSKVIEVTIPDTSNPPFGGAGQHEKDDRDLKQTLRDAVNTVTTRILSLARASSGDSAPDDLSNDVVKAAEGLCVDADNHYYFEQKALQLNLVVCNKGIQSISDVRIELGFPIVEDFDIADRIYVSPFDKRAQAKTNNHQYPNVERHDNGIYVRSTVGALEPSTPVPALKCPLRMAVGPAMENKKLAILYTLYRGDQTIGEGRLKIQFGKVVA